LESKFVATDSSAESDWVQFPDTSSLNLVLNPVDTVAGFSFRHEAKSQELQRQDTLDEMVEEQMILLHTMPSVVNFGCKILAKQSEMQSASSG
jgi:hypothetical protein